MAYAHAGRTFRTCASSASTVARAIAASANTPRILGILAPNEKMHDTWTSLDVVLAALQARLADMAVRLDIE